MDSKWNFCSNLVFDLVFPPRLLVSAVAAHFPGTTTLKYNGPTGAERAVSVVQICPDPDLDPDPGPGPMCPI